MNQFLYKCSPETMLSMLIHNKFVFSCLSMCQFTK
jgi:hypothetical protein